MNFLKRIFGAGEDAPSEPDIPFGRFSDAHKSAAQAEAFEKAETAFEEGRHLDTCIHFFDSLRDGDRQNIRYREENGSLAFEFEQGSRRIRGTVARDKIRAQTFLANADLSNVGLLRKLVEQNYSLKYCRYAIDDENRIAMVTDSWLVDASPMKMYHAFKELAILSDRLDDLLLDEFRALEPAEPPIQRPIPAEEVAYKYRYFTESIRAAGAAVDAGLGSPEKNTSGGAFLYLALLFRLDYLLRPEGYIMEEFARLYGHYFAKDSKPIERKVLDLRVGMERLGARSAADFAREIYRTDATFGFTKPVDHATVQREIEHLLGNIAWYKDHKNREVSLAVPNYIVGYCLYNFSVPRPDAALFRLYYAIVEEPFFKGLGFRTAYRTEEGGLERKNILKAIKNILAAHQAEYPRLQPDLKLLDFSSEVQFARTFLEMVKDLNLQKAG